MRRVLLLFALAVLAASVAAATPLCTGVLGTNVLTPGFECELGGLHFSAFSGVNAGSAPNPMQVNLVAATTVAHTVYLTFNPNLHSTSTMAADLWFYFTVTGGLIGVDLYNAGTPGSSIQEVVCSGPISRSPIPNICTGTVLANMAAASFESREVMFAPQSTVYIWKDILAAPPDGHISSFTQSFHTPEPMTFLLIGTGLLGLGLFGRRRAKK